MLLPGNFCQENGLIPVYHYTAPLLKDRIAANGLRLSSQGRGIAFSLLGPAALWLGQPSYEANVLASCFGDDKVEVFRGKHLADLVVVYGINPSVISSGAVGSNNVVVSKVSLQALALSNPDGDFFLRKDRIIGIFDLDTEAAPPAFEMSYSSELASERFLDSASKELIVAAQRQLELNKESVRAAERSIENERSFVTGSFVDRGSSLKSESLVSQPQKHLDGDAIEMTSFQLVSSHNFGPSAAKTSLGASLHLYNSSPLFVRDVASQRRTSKETGDRNSKAGGYSDRFSTSSYGAPEKSLGVVTEATGF